MTRATIIGRAQDEVGRLLLLHMLRERNGSVRATARALGVDRVYVYRDMRYFGISRDDF